MRIDCKKLQNLSDSETMNKGKNTHQLVCGPELAVTGQDWKLGALTDSSMKTSAKHLVAVNKANQMLGITRKETEDKAENVVTQL